MSLSLKFIRVDRETQLLVFGYARSYFLQHNDKIFPEFPIHLILLFFVENEYWSFAGDSIIKSSVFKSYDTILHSEKSDNHWDNTSYGNIKIPSTYKCICEWHIKLHNNNRGIVIGLTTNKSTANSKFFFRFSPHKYLYSPEHGEIRSLSHVTGAIWKSYGNGRYFYENINLCIKLDLIKRRISFIVNGQDLGIAYSNIVCAKGIHYNLAASLYYNNNRSAVTITKFCSYMP